MLLGSAALCLLAVMVLAWMARVELEPPPHRNLAPPDSILVRDAAYLVDKKDVEVHVAAQWPPAAAVEASFIFGLGLGMPYSIPTAVFCTNFGLLDDTAMMLGIVDALGFSSAACFDHVVGTWRTSKGTYAWASVWEVMGLSCFLMAANLSYLLTRDPQLGAGQGGKSQ